MKFESSNSISNADNISTAFSEIIDSVNVRVAILGSDTDPKRAEIVNSLQEAHPRNDVWMPEDKLKTAQYSLIPDKQRAEQVALHDETELIVAVAIPKPTGVPAEFTRYGRQRFFRQRTVLFYADDPWWKVDSFLLEAIKHFPRKYRMSQEQYKSCRRLRAIVIELVNRMRGEIALQQWQSRNSDNLSESTGLPNLDLDELLAATYQEIPGDLN